MTYQLVLQFPGDGLADYDELMSLEDILIEALGASAEVDGHDWGSNEMNIFILTESPKEVFDVAKGIIEQQRTFLLSDLRAAYRDVNESDYTLIWPLGAGDFKIT